MQKTFEVKPGCRCDVVYTYDYDEIYPEAVKVASSVRFPGFRRGHAPFGLVVRAYGMDAIFDNAFANMRSVETMYNDLVEGGHMSSFSPRISVKPVKKNEPVVFTVTWSIEPQVELGEYKGTKLLVPEEKVTDEMVDSAINAELRKQTSFNNITDRPCRDGELVNVDYVGTVDGQEFEGNRGENVTFRLGSGKFLSDLENGIVGMSVDEEKDIPVHFPESYSHGMGGKEAIFHVKLNGITEEKIPELDDEFVQDISEYDTVDEYRAYIRKTLEAQVEDRNRQQLENRIIDHVLNLSKVEISQEMINAQAEVTYNSFIEQYARQGQDYEKMLEEAGLGKRFGEMMARSQAEELLRNYVAHKKLVEDLGITVSDEDLNALMEESRESLGDKYDEYVASLTDEMKDALRQECEDRKMVEAMKELLEISFVAPDDPALNAPAAADEAEEKKPEDATSAPETEEKKPEDAASAPETEEKATEDGKE